MKNLSNSGKLELAFHLGIFCIMLWLGTQVSVKISYYGFLIPLFAFFFLNTFVLTPRFYVRANYRPYFSYLLGAFFVTYVLVWASTVLGNIRNGMTFSQIAIRYTHIRMETLYTLLGVTACSALYAFVRQLILDKEYLRLKRFSRFSTLLLLSILIFITGKYYIDVSWNGGENVHFIKTNEIDDLQKLLALPPFQNKVIYIDLWYSTCGPCRRGFINVPVIKEHFKGREIVYLYLAHETSLPNDKQHWKNVIREFDLSGWHYYMPEAFEKNIWRTITEETAISHRYPHYLLVDKNGVIQSYNSPRPGEKEALIAQIELLL